MKIKHITKISYILYEWYITGGVGQGGNKMLQKGENQPFTKCSQNIFSCGTHIRNPAVSATENNTIEIYLSSIMNIKTAAQIC